MSSSNPSPGTNTTQRDPTTTTTTNSLNRTPTSTQIGTGTGTTTTSTTTTFTLLLFGPVATYCHNKTNLTLTLPHPTTLHTLFSHLEQHHPGINAKVLRSCQIVRDLEYVDVDVSGVVDRVLAERRTTSTSAVLTPEGSGDGDGDGEVVMINPGDEIGLIPPVSAG